MFLATLPVALAIAVLAEPLLALFGDEFRDGAGAVRILVAGELVKAFLGLSGLLLVMTGHEGDLTRGVAIGGMANLVLAIVLVPLFFGGRRRYRRRGGDGRDEPRARLACSQAARLQRGGVVAFPRPKRA